MNAILLFDIAALFAMKIPEMGVDIFKKFDSSACVIPSYALKEIKRLTRHRRKEVRTQAVKLGLTIKDLCGFADGENLGSGSKTLVAYHRGVQEFLPKTDARLDRHGEIITGKCFPRVTRESKTVAIARYLQDKHWRIPVVIVSGKRGLHQLAAENDVGAIYLDEAEEFQKSGIIKRKKTMRFRRHAVGSGVFGKWV